MRREIIFGEEPQIVAHSSNKIVREAKLKDNSRKIASLQKKIEKMQSSGLWRMPYTHRRQRFLDGYTYEIEKLQKQIEGLGGTGGVDIEKQKLDQKIKAQLLKKIPGYFPTPKEVVKRMVELADIKDGDYILEPSAGTGAIIDGILETGKDVKLYPNELNYSNYEILLEKYQGNDNIICMNYDFSTYDSAWKFDKIIMNPPYEKLQDLEHTLKAFRLLQDGGILISLVSKGFLFRKEYEELKNIVSFYEEFSEGTFKLSGTNVGCVLLYIEK